jgi:hypothetical protein
MNRGRDRGRDRRRQEDGVARKVHVRLTCLMHDDLLTRYLSIFKRSTLTRAQPSFVPASTLTQCGLANLLLGFLVRGQTFGSTPGGMVLTSPPPP